MKSILPLIAALLISTSAFAADAPPFGPADSGPVATPTPPSLMPAPAIPPQMDYAKEAATVETQAALESILAQRMSAIAGLLKQLAAKDKELAGLKAQLTKVNQR